MNTLKRFLADTNGATAIEYGLISAGIATAIIILANALGSKFAPLGKVGTAL